jgi:hypothetical protein
MGVSRQAVNRGVKRWSQGLMKTTVRTKQNKQVMETKHFKGDLTVSPNNTKSNLSSVISFRLTERVADAMDLYLMSEPILGVRSPNGLARKVVLDFLEGRLTYQTRKPRKSIRDSGSSRQRVFSGGAH